MDQCPLCGEKNRTVIYPKVPQCPDTDIVRCDRCGHLYTVLHREIDTAGLYADEVYKVVDNRNSIFDRILAREYNNVLKQIETLQRKKGSVLDFGCGKGKFGSLAKANGWQVKCVETSPPRAAFAREVYGLDVNSDFYSSGNIFGMSFDALTLFHVLEHLPDPRPLLEALIKDNLNKDGLAVIEVPNVKSWQSRIAGEKWIHLDVPRHIHHFTPERLEQFLGEIGLAPVKKSYYSFHLGVLGMVDSLLRSMGYRKNIIYELKNRKSKSLLVKIALVLPFAVVLERLAAAAGKGGVIRMYLRRKEDIA
ncbi:MAG TPA: class I SAM-dependent methyltransferase [Puia sp.]|jgi:2-polyprenyl-3-methyl-5-hydroxy-6-metoxy-1,4-benzoquinol methylase|nr:class I SAM-dependent methyltransferase [Puia sp.]